MGNYENREWMQQRQEELEKQYKDNCLENLSLDLTRGKPNSKQLDLAGRMLAAVNADDLKGKVDYRNYGGLDGISEIKPLGTWLMDVAEDEVLAYGNSSLTLMHQYLSMANFFGVEEEAGPWRKAKSVKFLCPVPGYDRHFSICEQLGIKMIPVPVTGDGIDMDVVEDLLDKDPDVKGIWCVPKYSNPTGHIYSEEVIKRLAALKPAAPDFRIMWDNAYAVHDFFEPKELVSLMRLATMYHNQDQVIILASTSKITFAGAGIGFLGASQKNLDRFRNFLSYQSIGPDKINQFRHHLMFPSKDSLINHMKEQANLLRPKFELVNNILTRNFGDNPIIEWSEPQGGYFVSVNTLPGVAAETIALAKGCGVKLTPAGSTFPYKKDPQDRNIRIAPTFPPSDELEKAMEVFVICVELATIRSKLNL